MAGNRKGGLKTKATVLASDELYYHKIGKKGGQASAGGRIAHDHDYAVKMAKLSWKNRTKRTAG
jgi:general stress protein YciG